TYLRSKGVRAAYFIVDVTRDRLDRISAMIERGTLNLPVGEVLELADASTAHGMLDGAPHKPGKIVLKVADWPQRLKAACSLPSRRHYIPYPVSRSLERRRGPAARRYPSRPPSLDLTALTRPSLPGLIRRFELLSPAPRDFSPVFVRFGSFTSFPPSRRVRFAPKSRHSASARVYEYTP